MKYRVQFGNSAKRQFLKLTHSTQERLRPHIDALSDNPHPPGLKKLKGKRDYWRIRVGDYRIIYTIHDDVLIVWVVEVGHRREVCR